VRGVQVEWLGPQHRGQTPDRVGELVAAVGPVAGLYALEDAERVALQLASEARERAQHHTAAGLEAAALIARRQQFELVERFA